jgi:pseudouridine synthase
VPLEEGPSQPVAVKLLRRRSDRSLLELEMGEGRNRQIRRTAELLGHPVLDLQRRAIGSLRLGGLPEGQWRMLSRRELHDQQWGTPADRR